jgi:two-component system, chemotaxis family, response regulator PixG
MLSKTITQALSEKLQSHKQNQFTGLVHIGVGKIPQWSLYFHMGRLVWAHSRIHPVRRWYRQLVKHCPALLKSGAGAPDTPLSYEALHYSKLVAKVRQGELNRIHLAKAIEGYLTEILFDIVHQGTLRLLQSKPAFAFLDIEKRFSSSLFLIVRAEQAWQQAQSDWQAWQQAELVKCSPNLAPVIGQAEELRKRTSDAVYQHLVEIIDGKQTFRDIAVRLEQPLLPLTRRIVPYIGQGVMGLVRVDDLGAPPSAAQPSASPKISAANARPAATGDRPKATQPRAANPKAANPKDNQGPLIIYIDDSPADSRKMGEILQNAGFRFRNIQESTHALPLLIEHKPKMIFLDLVMPVANGYEICSQVRRVSLFKDIPIVIVTSNDTLADRVKAKMVGASGFLGKPIQREQVLKVVHKLLNGASQPLAKAAIA